jgi:glycosyltransferase involved in cell wall biosynthesis
MISFLIIVPTLNSHHLLPTLVESLSKQTFPHWKVLFIDGFSNINHRNYLQEICETDHRFTFIDQELSDPGIFGAMNQGIRSVDFKKDWILFWGSDDQAASPSAFEDVATRLQYYREINDQPDLIVCSGMYYSRDLIASYSRQNRYGRRTRFSLRHSFRRSLFLGSTPPHQATFFGPRVLSYLPSFSPYFQLSADLDYFLRLSLHTDIKVKVEDIHVVLMGDSGVSNKQAKRRFNEVRIAYKNAFGAQWWIPYCLRYLQRIQSLAESQWV